MKKTTMYFADQQAEALTTKAMQIGISFAEIVRRALDEWLAAQRGDRPMTIPKGTKTVYVRLDEEDFTKTFRNAYVQERYDDGAHLIVVRREEGIDGKTLGSFKHGEVKYWYIEEPEDESGGLVEDKRGAIPGITPHTRMRPGFPLK